MKPSQPPEFHSARPPEPPAQPREVAAELRRRAEESLKTKTRAAAAPQSPHETQKLLHELQVHQIELEMQNGELRKSQAEVEAGLARYTDLYDFAPAGYFTLQVDGGIVQTNLAGARLLGTERALLAGKRFGAFVSQADLPVFNSLLQQVFVNEIKQTCEVELVSAGQPQRHVRIEAALASDGRDCRLVIVDITERKGMEEAVRESQKMEAMGILAGGVAHDFNNIVAAILGNVALAKKDLAAGDVAGTLLSLEEIGKAGERAKALVRQILTFSRKQPQEFAIQPLRPLVEEALKLLRATLPSVVEIKTAFAAEPLAVRADAVQIGQVLVNLCTNAWHAIEDHAGSIAIELTDALVDSDHGGRLDGLASGRYARIRITDSGRGMDAATQARIFEPFFTTKGVGVGTGLGLSVVHGIVKSHQGAITVESTPGKGSRFDVYLPVTQAPIEAESAPSARPALPQAQGQHLLYVDDDESLVLLVTRTMKRQGYRVSGFDSGAAALEAVRENPDEFDLVLTDFNMPGFSGLEVAKELQRFRPGLPMVITSGYVSEELTASASAVGVREVVFKPNTVDELCASICRLLETVAPDGDE